MAWLAAKVAALVYDPARPRHMRFKGWGVTPPAPTFLHRVRPADARALSVLHLVRDAPALPPDLVQGLADAWTPSLLARILARHPPAARAPGGRPTPWSPA